jgi:prevent-host-death family protein
MPKLPSIVPISDLRDDAAAVLERVRKSREPLVITQRGRTAAVLLSADAFERGEREREILRLIARGERELREGKSVDLDAVLAEADEILSRDA